MRKRFGWFVLLALLSLLAAACGPSLATPTPSGEGPVAASPTTAEEAPAPTATPVPAADLPVDQADWRSLGSPDAPVTLVEYSDFQ